MRRWSSAPLWIEENKVGRCAFDLTEWHLPRYPREEKSTVKTFVVSAPMKTAGRMYSWLLSADCDLGTGDVFRIFFYDTFLLSPLHLYIIYWTFLSLLFFHTHPSLPSSLLFTQFFPLFLSLPLSLINNYRSLYLPWKHPLRTGLERETAQGK